MPFTQDINDELNMLMRFNKMHSTQQGIKVHSDADAEVIAATQRLYEKGIISQDDGGYLTDLGLEAVELAEKLLNIMSSSAGLAGQ